jgi:histidinol-phosphate phosphatase family protein
VPVLVTVPSRAPAPPEYAVVIPTVGRPSLQHCLDALGRATGPPPAAVVLADDRPSTPQPLDVRIPAPLAGRVTEVTLEGRGPAAARNAGWRAAPPVPWIVFLDDDVQVGPCWADELAADLAGLAPRVAAVQGRITVPRPAGRRPTDAERGTIGLEGARWITADMAFRRAALADTAGFDERFPRAFREDSELALRLLAQGWELRQGTRQTYHPVRPARRWASVRAQAGNADDAAMSALHGRGWRVLAAAPAGRRPWHLLTCVLAGLSLAALAAGRRRPAALAGAGWLALTSEFAQARIRPGPRTRAECAEMIATSVAIPPAAVGHWLAGWRRFRHAAPWPPRPAAVLFDRDGTLVHDVPYNADPALVTALPQAAAALARLRAAGIGTAIVTNQSGVARGLISPGQLKAVNERVDAELGPFGTWAVCPHGEDHGCGCRKPRNGLILQAAAALGVDPADCVVIGDTGADVAAAGAAGARAILVPNAQTAAAERTGVPVARDLAEAVAAVLGERQLRSWPGQP